MLNAESSSTPFSIFAEFCFTPEQEMRKEKTRIRRQTGSERKADRFSFTSALSDEIPLTASVKTENSKIIYNRGFLFKGLSKEDKSVFLSAGMEALGKLSDENAYLNRSICEILVLDDQHSGMKVKNNFCFLRQSEISEEILDDSLGLPLMFFDLLSRKYFE